LEQQAAYTITSDWTAPVADPVTISRYHEASVGFRVGSAHAYSGVAIATNLPAIAFTARWRRDDKDGWHVVQAPAVAGDAGHTVAYLGETDCGPSTIPLVFLERGIELELSAELPDGSKATLPLPKPFVLPPAKP
jgi:hypothetical protein